MLVGSKFHRSDAATGKERRPTVVSRNAAQAAAVTMKTSMHDCCFRVQVCVQHDWA